MKSGNLQTGLKDSMTMDVRKGAKGDNCKEKTAHREKCNGVTTRVVPQYVDYI